MGGWGGIIINFVVALKKSVRRCGCFQEPYSTQRARYVWWWGGVEGGAGRDNYILTHLGPVRPDNTGSAQRSRV